MRGQGEPENWTGFYFGINAGYAWSNADFGITPTGSWAGFPGPAANIQSSTDGTLHLDGFTGGIQLGFNKQVGTFVWGLEADINGGPGMRS